MFEVDLLRLMKFLFLSLFLLPILLASLPLWMKLPRLERAHGWDQPLAKDVFGWAGRGKKMNHMMRVSKRDKEWIQIQSELLSRIGKREEERRPKEESMIPVSKMDEEWTPKEDHMM